MDKTTEKYKYFTNDVRPKREKHWLSLFYQLSVPICLEDVSSVLEFGPGRGLMGACLKHYQMDYTSVDVVDGYYGYKPDYISNIKNFETEKKFDLVCAFQTLEHNPPETFIPHLKKMAEASNKYVFVSLPYYGRWFSFNISVNFPKIDRNFSKVFCFDRLFPKKRPIEKYKKSETPYDHHWFEIGDKGFRKKDLKKLASQAGLKINKSFHSHSFPYHIFILMEKEE